MDRLTAVARLAGKLAPGKLQELRTELAAMLPGLLGTDVAYEIVLQSYLFFGYAQAIESAKVLSEVLHAKGLNPPTPPRESHDWSEWRRRGESLCAEIYRPNFERLVANMTSVSPELGEWMVVEGYGKVLSRPGPTPIEREVASIIFLAVSNHPVQLYSHVRGARNLGIAAQLLASAIAAAELTTDQTGKVMMTMAQVFGG